MFLILYNFNEVILMDSKRVLTAVRDYIEDDDLLGKNLTHLKLKGLLKNELEYKQDNQVVREKTVLDDISFFVWTRTSKHNFITINIEFWIQRNVNVPKSYSDNVKDSEISNYHKKFLNILDKKFIDNSTSTSNKSLDYADYKFDYDGFVGLRIMFSHSLYYPSALQEDSNYNISEEIYKLIKESHNIFFVNDTKFRDILIDLVNPIKLISVEMKKSNDELEDFSNDFQKKLDQITEKNKKK